jgi:hypothetical protein
MKATSNVSTRQFQPVSILLTFESEAELILFRSRVIPKVPIPESCFHRRDEELRASRAKLNALLEPIFAAVNNVIREVSHEII